MSDKPIVICKAVKDVSAAAVPYPGSKKLPCAACGTLVYITPASRQMVTETNADMLCEDCAAEHIEGADTIINVMSEDQRKEINHMLNPESN